MREHDVNCLGDFPKRQVTVPSAGPCRQSHLDNSQSRGLMVAQRSFTRPPTWTAFVRESYRLLSAPVLRERGVGEGFGSAERTAAPDSITIALPERWRGASLVRPCLYPSWLAGCFCPPPWLHRNKRRRPSSALRSCGSSPVRTK